MLRALPEDGVDALLRQAGPDAGAPYLVELRHAGGALNRPGSAPSALGRRDGAYVLYAGGAADASRTPGFIAELEQLTTSMAPWGTGGVCVNFLSGPDVTAEQLASGYLPTDLERLAEIKAAVDPGDMFRTHHGRCVRGS